MRSIPKWLPSAVLLLAAAGCAESEKPASPSTSTAASTAAAVVTAGVKAPSGPTSGSKFVIDTAGSKVDFLMEAPQEKIVGHVPGATTGELHIDGMATQKATGSVVVDISGIEVFQAKPDKDGKFGSETKVEAQNKHARTWLEISDDAPADKRKENATVRLVIKSMEPVGESNLAKIPGAERKVTMKVTGDFTLHGKTVEKTAEVEATFKVEGDKPVSVAVKTLKPFSVGLAEHDVKPRDAFGKFAAKTLEVLSPKVNKEALVSLDFTAKLVP